MCDKPLEERAGIFYIKVSSIPQWISDDRITRSFSRFGPIRHVEVHGDCPANVTGDHCYIGYSQLSEAKALQIGQYYEDNSGEHCLELSLVWRQFSVSYGRSRC